MSKLGSSNATSNSKNQKAIILPGPGLVDRFLNVAQILAFGPKICRIFCWDGSAQDTSSAHPARALACSLIVARRRGFLNSSDIIHGFSYNPRNNSWILTQLNISLQ